MQLFKLHWSGMPDFTGRCPPPSVGRSTSSEPVAFNLSHPDLQPPRLQHASAPGADPQIHRSTHAGYCLTYDSQRWSPELEGREVANGRNTRFTPEEPSHPANRYCGSDGRTRGRWTGTAAAFFHAKVANLAPLCFLCVSSRTDRPCLRQVPSNRTAARAGEL
ncbi:hypothetical protein PAMA_018860 [Pampus argenteus]